jgi:septal ring factor EnvC (AmiA/AmiB activator)
MEVMSDSNQNVSDVSRRLNELRKRLEELRAERDAIETQITAQIAVCVEQLASHVDSGGHSPAAALIDRSPRGQVLAVLLRNPNRPMAPADVAEALGITDAENLRGVMSRMARDGRARRVAHGRYLPP